MTLRTYIYEVNSINGSFVGWYPTQASNVLFQYSALGLANPPGVAVNGPTIVCTNGTFTVDNVPQNYSIAWSTSSHLQIQSSSGNSVTVSKLYNGNGWVRATITANGCSTPYTKNIQVGPTTANFSISSYPTCGGPGQVFDFVANQTGVTYDWTVNGGTLMGGQATQAIWAMMNSQSMSVHCYVTGTSSGNCYSPQGISSTYVYECWGFAAVTTTPNPTSTSFEVQLAAALEDTEEVQIEIRNDSGTPIKMVKGLGNRFVVSTLGLDDGMYFLRVKYRDKVLNHRIIVNK